MRGELDSLKQVSVKEGLKAAKAYPEHIVGFKVRLSADCADDGKTEAEGYRRALEMSREAGLPLMTHHAFSTVPLAGTEGCPGALRRGDIYTHMYMGFESTIIEEGVVSPAVHQAREEGVLFDMGHGQA